MVFVGGGFPFGDVIPLETVLTECFIDFVAYLEGGKGDAGARRMGIKSGRILSGIMLTHSNGLH